MITQGKWTWKQNRGNNVYEHSVRADNGRQIIAELSGEGCTKEEVKANARLIAAAPELLEALEAAELSLNECTRHLLGTGPIPDPEAVALTIIQIKEAIAKANS